MAQLEEEEYFFNLLYWSSLLIRHNLDVMHIEKNICEALLGTLLEIAGKTKDTEKARLDLQDMGIRKDQHPVLEKGKYKLPVGLYKLSLGLKQILCNFLHDLLMSKVARLLDIKVMTTILYFKSFYPWWHIAYRCSDPIDPA